MAALKDVLVVGYGAVGTIFSLILKRSGRARVTVVARSNYEAVSANGMHIQSKKYGNIEGWKPDRLFPALSEALDRPYSHVVITTKAIPEVVRTPELLGPLLSSPYADEHPQPTYVLMQNGLNVESDLYQALSTLRATEQPRIISTAVYIGTRMLGPAAVEHNDFDRVSLGVYRPSLATLANTPSEASLLAEFADMLSVGGSDVTVVPEIQRVKFAKNMWNCVFGSVATLARHPLPAIFRAPKTGLNVADGAMPPAGPSPDLTPSHIATSSVPHFNSIIHENTIPFLHDALTELYTLGAVLYPATEASPGLDPDVVQKIMRSTSRLHADPENTHRPSMLVDVEMGRPMELEVVVGEVVRMGRKAGVSIPRVETLYAILLIMQHQLLSNH